MDNISEPHVNAVKSLSYDCPDADVSFVRGLLKSINPSTNKVSFERLTGTDPSVPIQAEEMAFDVLVLATGAQYVAPWRDGLSADEWQTNEMRKQQVAGIRQ